MLSIGKLGSGSEDYYLHAVAAGREDYYLRADEAPGRWLSDGGLDLSGEVGAPELRALLAGRDPHDDSQLVRGPAGGRARTPGFDLTFSAPKSVSLLFALGDPSRAGPAIGAHERAVDAAIGYLEGHAAFLRRGHNGTERVPALGLVAAGFRHRASRAGDPALHTHVLVANLAQDADGRFGALDSRAIYRNAKSAGYVYQQELRHQLSGDLGVEWGAVSKGAAEIAGFPRRRAGRLQPPPGRDRAAPHRARAVGSARRRGGGARYARRQGLLGARRGSGRRLARASAGARLRRA